MVAALLPAEHLLPGCVRGHDRAPQQPETPEVRVVLVDAGREEVRRGSGRSTGVRAGPLVPEWVVGVVNAVRRRVLGELRLEGRRLSFELDREYPAGGGRRDVILVAPHAERRLLARP